MGRGSRAARSGAVRVNFDTACSLHCPDAQNTQGFSYVYDRYANRWQQNLTAGNGSSMILTFSGNNNRMDCLPGHPNCYDASGNLVDDGVHNYFYNAESQLIQVDGTLGNCSSATACYVYDADGKRVQKTTSAGSVDYIYDVAGNQVAEVNSSGAMNRGEMYAGGLYLATYTAGAAYGGVAARFKWGELLEHYTLNYNYVHENTTRTVSGFACDHHTAHFRSA